MDEIRTSNQITTGWNLDNSYIHLPDRFYTRMEPTPVSSPNIIFLNNSLAEALGLNPDYLLSDVGVSLLAGKSIPDGASPIAQAYAGHQFGHFTMLGDGRAILLGEQITPEGKRYDVQLKGSGRTPYSRGGDGRAAIGPMLREYIISEALFNLGIATTRSLAVVTTGEEIIRETKLAGAILTRLASSHIRVCTFEYISAYGSQEELQKLADYAIQRHYPDIILDENKYLKFIREVVKQQAELVTKWQLVGFIHGVMNTDNMTISGESIDFGPCAFMDTYDPSTVFSSIDRNGRYAYRNQPNMAIWNLARFAETLLPLIHDNEDEAISLASESVIHFQVYYNELWLNGMRAKLGLVGEDSEDESIISELFDLMHNYNGDFTNTFRSLTLSQLNGTDLFDAPEYSQWTQKWEARRNKQDISIEESNQLMHNNNPTVIPRNYRVEEALEAAKHGDYSIMIKLNNILSNPYAYSVEQEEYAAPPPPSACKYRTFCGT
ncbi:MAG: YdiU family protein [Clostridiales bacterium]|nr:YdiU family protein [Clostridiales bacterium]